MSACESIRKTSRALAYEKALCLNKSHFGEIVTGRNFMETKMLETKLKLLEKDKLMVERDLFWKQRQFFIDKAFDKERRLKYKRLLSNISLKEEDLTRINSASIRSRNSAVTCHDVTLTHQFFPGKIHTETSVNYKRIQQQKQKLWATVNVFRAALERRKKYKEGKTSEKDPQSLHQTESQQPGDGQITRNSNEISLLEAKNSTFLKLVAKNWKNFKRTKSKPEPAETIFPPKIQRQSAKRDSSILPVRLPERRNSRVSTDSDRVLLKLAMTLPPQVLTEADDKLADVSDMLGFSSRNRMLRQREMNFLRRPVLFDNRFVNLQNSLSRSYTSHY